MKLVLLILPEVVIPEIRASERDGVVCEIVTVFSGEIWNLIVEADETLGAG